MANSKRMWGLSLITIALVMAGCGTTVPISSVKAPTIDTQGIQRMAVRPFTNVSGAPEGTPLATYLSTKTEQEIRNSGKFTMVAPTDPQADGIFTGRITRIGVDFSQEPYQTKDSKGNILNKIRYTRKVSLEFDYSIISARTEVAIGTVMKSGNTSDSQDSSGALASVEILARRIIDSELKNFAGDVIPRIVTTDLKLMDETSNDKVVKDKMKTALAVVKAGNYEDALKQYDEIAKEHNSTAARTNAGYLRRSIESASAAKSELAQLFEDKDGTVEKALKGVFSVLDEKLSSGSNITIMKQQSVERNMLDYVVDEMTKTIVKEGKIKVMDRSNQALIDTEQRFQTSGAVSDETMVSLGKQLGVKYMVFCWISGEKSLRRLNLKVLNIETAQIADQSAFEI